MRKENRITYFIHMHVVDVYITACISNRSFESYYLCRPRRLFTKLDNIEPHFWWAQFSKSQEGIFCQNTPDRYKQNVVYFNDPQICNFFNHYSNYRQIFNPHSCTNVNAEYVEESSNVKKKLIKKKAIFLIKSLWTYLNLYLI